MALRYITLSDLKDEIPETLQASLTDDTPNSEVKVDDILTQKAKTAEQEVESYLSSRYQIPLKASDGTIPSTIVQAIYTICKYRLYARRDAIDGSVQAQYDSTVTWLRGVGLGKMNLNLIDASGNVESEGGVSILVSTYLSSQIEGVFV